MAASNRVQLVYTWPDGDKFTVTVDAANSYPDALSQAGAEALRCLREGVDYFKAEAESEDDRGGGTP